MLQTNPILQTGLLSTINGLRSIFWHFVLVSVQTERIPPQRSARQVPSVSRPVMKPFLESGSCGLEVVNTSAPPPFNLQLLQGAIPLSSRTSDLVFHSQRETVTWEVDPSQRATQDTSPAGHKDREQSKGLCTPRCSAQHPHYRSDA